MQKLTYTPFTVVSELKAVIEDGKVIRQGDKNLGVYFIQTGLLDLGYNMPANLNLDDDPNSRFDSKTKEGVIQFQIDRKLPKKDGVVDARTLLALDKILAKKYNIPSSPKKVNFSKNKPNQMTRVYKVGEADPSFSQEKGIGKFNSVEKEMAMVLAKKVLLSQLPPKGFGLKKEVGPNAVKHLKHYLDATGVQLTLDVEGMVLESSLANGYYRNEVMAAKKFSETLSPGSHSITSTTALNADHHPGDSRDWFYAIGGYLLWGTGEVIVSKDMQKIELEFEYNIRDNYNWHKDKTTSYGVENPLEISDEFMGKFHLQGLAKEFKMIGKLTRKFTWIKGEPLPDNQYH